MQTQRLSITDPRRSGALLRSTASGGARYVRRILLILSVAIVAGSLELCAQVDQDHWVPHEFNNNFNSLLGLQQEFTPLLDSMDSAQFSLGQGLMGVTSLLGGALVLNIREGGVDGPIVAASAPIVVPPMFHGNIVFRFDEPVALAPGRVYAMEPFSPTQATLIFDANRLGFTPGYDRGRLFYNGAFEGADLLFREGIGLVPEPATLFLWALAAIGAVVSRFRQRTR